MGFMKYPELVRLDKRPEILSVKEVVATEKIHGTNFRVHFRPGIRSTDEVEFGGRNEELGTDGAGFYGGRPAAFFRNQTALLQRMLDTFASYGFSEVTVFGEAFGSGVQRGVRYVPDDRVIFRAFDIAVGENLVTYDLFVRLADAMGLARVPEIWRGAPSLEAFDALLERPSVEGERNGVKDDSNVAEGVVIRATPLLRDVFGQWLIIKHKAESFSEVAKRDRTPRADLSPADDFVRTFVLPGRIENALGRLRDAGIPVVDDMQDMANLVPAMVKDLHKECMNEWNAVVAAGVTDKALRGAVTKAVGSTYRRMLLERVAKG
jgi:Rnl2 family RNA ligase